MQTIHNIVHIICEGKTEYNYIQELNRFLREFDANTTLKPHDAEGGTVKKITHKYKAVKRNNHKQEIHIWADKDIYIRHPNEQEAYERKKTPNFKFNFNNGEDFLIMHLKIETIKEWQNICQKNNHFQTPFTHRQTEIYINHIFSNYKKGKLPNEIKITHASLQNLFDNQRNKNIKFKSDIIEVIEQITPK